MSQPNNDGGPAYPTPAGVQHNDGMTLRDYFAAAALQGQAHRFAHPDELEHHIAKWSYKAADAMIRAREAK